MASHAIEIQDIVRLPDPKKQVTASLREVISDLRGKPARFVRLRLEGWHFPERALEPFVVVGDQVSRFVQISPDGMSADAYFDKGLQSARRVEFGYGKTVSWTFPVAISPQRIQLIDRATLSAEMRRLFE